MAKTGHGNHWECVVELNKAVQEIVPSVLQNGSKIEKSEVIANCFENKIPTTTKILSISDDNEITPKILVAENPEEQTYEVVTGYPFIQSKSIIKLKIIEINEWENLIEAVITGETKDKEKISFFDTNYFLNKETYEIGKIYDFSISAMAYAVEILEETSFSFEGQNAIDWHAKLGEEPIYDESGNIEPVVIHLDNLVALIQADEDYPDDAEFQSPIKSMKTIRAFDQDFYKFKITVFRDPDIDIDLYAKADFFNRKPKINYPLRGYIWLQGKKE